MRFRPRADYAALRAYDTQAAPCEVELADNTSVFGTPPAARALLAGAGDVDLTRYPSTYSRALREAIAEYVGVMPEEIMVGAGSDEVMSCTFRALAAPGSTVAFMSPTFVMTPVFAQTNSVMPQPVPLTASHDPDVDALLSRGATLTYLCTPNNPTGKAIPRALVDRVVHDARGLVLIDEAYAEYAGTNLAGEAPAHGDVLVYRTFSKAFGLAGARVGFAVGSRPLIAELEKARGPYTVSLLSERLAHAVLTRDLPWVRDRVQETIAVRTSTAATLADAGFVPLPSAANFLCVPVQDAATAAAGLLTHGIRVRAFPRLPGIGDALRITIGQASTMERVVDALRTCATPS